MQAIHIHKRIGPLMFTLDRFPMVAVHRIIPRRFGLKLRPFGCWYRVDRNTVAMIYRPLPTTRTRA